MAFVTSNCFGLLRCKSVCGFSMLMMPGKEPPVKIDDAPQKKHCSSFTSASTCSCIMAAHVLAQLGHAVSSDSLKFTASSGNKYTLFVV
jgi:hypothetical protein